jgi:hypothetical protein
MKKQKTELKKLRIDKETLLPLGSRQIEELAGGMPISPVGHLATTTFVPPRLSASLRHPPRPKGASGRGGHIPWAMPARESPGLAALDARGSYRLDDAPAYG